MVVEDGRELIALRALADTTPTESAARRDTLRALREALSAAGLPVSKLRSVDTVSESAGDDAPTGRLRAELTGLAMIDLGTLLDRWRASSPSWTVVGIDLRAGGNRGAGGSYDVTLTLVRRAPGSVGTVARSSW
ncbi:MAG: hypothetical protein AAFQ71_11575 [Planctomycetota bacterium]